MAEQAHQHEHDSHDHDGYKKRCYCEKCVKSYDAWCKREKEHGKTTCKRKCYTVCEIVCDRTNITRKDYGVKKRYEGRWEHYRPIPAPKHCESCKKSRDECSCSSSHK